MKITDLKDSIVGEKWRSPSRQQLDSDYRNLVMEDAKYKILDKYDGKQHVLVGLLERSNSNNYKTPISIPNNLQGWERISLSPIESEQ